MADERDLQVSQRYRELGAEEPPRALDDAILAASRRSVRKRSWYGPVALAATLVLVVAVTVQVERQKPDDEYVAMRAPAPAQGKQEPLAEKAPKSLPEPRSEPKPAKEQPRESASRRSSGFAPDPAPATPAPAAPAQQSADAMRDLAKAQEAPAPATATEEREAGSSARARAQVEQRSDAAEAKRMEEQLQAQRSAPAPAAAPARPAASVQAAPRPQEGARASGAVAPLYVGPQRWLEQIAELRKEGKHEDADKLLEEFRKTYPDYRIPDEMRAKVEKQTK